MKKNQFLLLLLLSFSTMAYSQWQGTNPVYFNAGNVGIGTTTPGAKLSFMDVSVSSTSDGITWYNPSPLQYGIYRTSGTWVAPNYQQLKMNFLTGIILDPGSASSKSYVDVQGGGLRVSAGNTGIGTIVAPEKLTVGGGNFAIFGTGLDGSTYQRTVIYSDATYGLLVEAPKNSAGSKMNIEFNWRGGGTTPFFINGGTGNIGIGTKTPGTFKLAVEGKIGAREVNITTTTPWPDYVFEADYALPSLESIKVFINKNKHLPEIPTTHEVETNGVNLGEMNMLLLKKIEELTLYLIEQNKLIINQNERISKLENKN